jgi:hypothetical protein
MKFLPFVALAAARHTSSGISGAVLLILVVLVIAVGYLVSLSRHPYTRCRGCRGTPGRNWGSIYRRAYRPCGSCGGTGRKDRLGARALSGRPRE